MIQLAKTLIAIFSKEVEDPLITQQMRSRTTLTDRQVNALRRVLTEAVMLSAGRQTGGLKRSETEVGDLSCLIDLLPDHNEAEDLRRRLPGLVSTGGRGHDHIEEV